jgi:hypothetical protein
VYDCTCFQAIIDSYVQYCNIYGVEPNGGVLVALRYKCDVLRPTSKFFCKDMLALADVLSAYKEQTSHIVKADFSLARVKKLFRFVIG